MRSIGVLSALLFAALTVSAAGRHLPARPVKKAPPPIDQQALRTQVLLDRAHFSPGQIDASWGNVTKVMLAAFQKQNNLPPTGASDDATTQALEQATQSATTTVFYTLTYDDLRGPFSPLPSDIMQQAQLPSLNYQSPWDALGEKFHSSPSLLRRLNPKEISLKPGDSIVVPNVHRDIPQGAASISVSKASRVVQLLDAGGKPVATYPATIGSDHDPLPLGDWKVTHIQWNPTFYYNPALFWNAGPQDSKATIKPGPRNPVGVVWIGLDKEHYGLHGTPNPATVGHEASHGCVRLTNWDAAEIAQTVGKGASVRFEE
jgi:lipoprotein-anchoring transpeptidase ErfK/SrfK